MTNTKLWMVVVLILICLVFFMNVFFLPDYKVEDTNNIKDLQTQVQFLYDRNLQLEEKIQIMISTKPTPVPNNSDRALKLCEESLELEKVRATLDRLNAQMQTPPLPKANTDTVVMPILVLCYNRPDYLARTLDALIRLRPSAEQFPIIVSQDGTNQDVWKLVNGDKYYKQVTAIQFVNRKTKANSYFYISQHFKFAISTVLEKLQYKQVIIVEDDLEFAPDFFEYFLAMNSLVRQDNTIYTASAWNDNGQESRVRNGTQLKRTDFFPGLGWLMTDNLWSELGPKWPEGYWDDWMREPAQQKGRQVIIPEICRTYTFGEEGSSQGQFFNTYLKPIKLYDGPIVPFTSFDFSYLRDDKWFDYIREKISRATLVPNFSRQAILSGGFSPSQPLLATYQTFRDFAQLANTVSIMNDEKAGVHRTAYKGVVYFYDGEREIFFAKQNYKDTFNLK